MLCKHLVWAAFEEAACEQDLAPGVAALLLESRGTANNSLVLAR